MTDLLLSERDQAALRAVLATEIDPTAALPAESALPALARLIPCDASGVALLDDAGYTVEDTGSTSERAPDAATALGRPRLGIQQLERETAHGVAVLSLGTSNGPDLVCKLWMVRRAGDFSDRDRALLALVAPLLVRLLRERPSPSSPASLTVQERRVLRYVATGLSNAEVAERLGIAPCTVRKHLEHAYRKLGVTNRLAAVFALADEHPAPAMSVTSADQSV